MIFTEAASIWRLFLSTAVILAVFSLIEGWCVVEVMHRCCTIFYYREENTSMIHETTRMPTLGVIASELGQPLHRIAYIVRTRGIRPVARAGNLRLFDRHAKARIRYELNKIDAQREDSR